jgi:hypothetical protein
MYIREYPTMQAKIYAGKNALPKLNAKNDAAAKAVLLWPEGNEFQ